jgi:large subunit ribosomal protein L22
MSQTIVAHQKFIRQTPRKLRLVADLVRKLSVEEATTQLLVARKRAAKSLLKVLAQAKANALNNSNLDTTTLKISTIEIQEGPTYKRFQPVSRGRAHRILKRSSHIKIELTGQEKSADVKKPNETKPRTAKPTTKAKEK